MQFWHFFILLFFYASLQPINGYTVWESSKHICLSTFCKKFRLSLHNHFLISFEEIFLNLPFNFASFDVCFGRLYVDGVNPQNFLFSQKCNQPKSWPELKKKVTSGCDKKVMTGTDKNQKPGTENNRYDIGWLEHLLQKHSRKARS